MSDLPATESFDPRFKHLESLATLTAATALWEGQLAAIAAMRPALPAISAAVEEAAERLGETGRLIYCGAGTSARIGAQDGAELPPTFDWPSQRLAFLIAGGPAALMAAIENAEDDAARAREEIEALTLCAHDVVIGLAASGNTPYTVAAITTAREKGALTIGIANSPNTKLLSAAKHPILLDTGAEPIAGSTRLKAGTAQKVALNLISTLIMVRLGKIYQGHMVEMVARNEKLRDRAQRMVMNLAMVDAATAKQALAESNGNVKTALKILKTL